MMKAIYGLPRSMTESLSPTMKSTIITMSSSISVVGIASGILNREPTVTGCSILWGVTNFIAWLDLGASEKIKGYKEGFLLGVEKETGESKQIADLLKDLEGIKKERQELQRDAERMLKLNSELESFLAGEKRTVETLQQIETESQILINNLQMQLSTQEEKIAELQRRETLLQGQIQESKRSMESAISLIQDQMKTISDLNGQIKELNTTHGRL